MGFREDVLAHSPLTYLRLGETSGSTAADETGQGRAGTYGASVTLNQPSLQWSDANPSILVPNSSHGGVVIPYASWMERPAGSGFTAGILLKPSSVSGNRAVMNRCDYNQPTADAMRSWFIHQSSNRFSCGVYTDSGATESGVQGPTLVAGEDYFVVLTWDGATVRLYVDGTQVYSAARAGTLRPSANVNLSIGVEHGNGVAERFAGNMDEAFYLPTALDATQVAALQQSALPTMVRSAAFFSQALVTLDVAPVRVAAFYEQTLVREVPDDGSADISLAGVVPAVVADVDLGMPTPVQLAGQVPGVTASLVVAVPANIALAGQVPAVLAGVDLTIAPITLTMPVGPVPLPFFTAPRAIVLGASQAIEFTTYPGLLDAPEPPALVILDTEQRRAPTSVQIAITNATPGEEFMVAIDGIDVYPVTIDVDGNLDPTSIRVDEIHGAGTHTLTATGVTSILTATFTLDADAPAHPAIQGPDADPVFIPESEVAGGPYRWVLQDLMPGGLGSWVMPLNPLSMSSPHRRKTLSVEHTTSPTDGRFHAVESHQPPQDWQFAGYCPDQAFHEQLEAYAALNRRLYVIDHRQRAWVVAILGVEFRARKRQRQDAGVFNDWASDYTVNALILDQDWRAPA